MVAQNLVEILAVFAYSVTIWSGQNTKNSNICIVTCIIDKLSYIFVHGYRLQPSQISEAGEAA